MRAADGLHTGFRKPEVLDLPRSDQVLHGPGYILHRYVRVNPMLIEQVDVIGPEPFQRCIGDGPDTLRPAVRASRGIPVLEAELSGNHDLVTDRRQGFAHDFLIREGAVGFGGIKERHAKFESLTDKRNCLLLFLRRAITKTQTHAAEANSRNFKSALT